LIPRSILFGNPEKTDPQLSPDGARLGYLAPDDGVLNVWVRSVAGGDDRAVTRDRGRGIRSYFWAKDNQHLLYIQDQGGDENWHLYAVHLDSGSLRDLTPFAGVRVQEVFLDYHHPDQILVEMNRRNPELMDVWRCRLSSAELSLEVENRGDFVGWIADHEFQIRAAYAARADGGYDLLLRSAGGEFEDFLSWGHEERQNVFGFTPDGRGLYLADSLAADTMQLYEMDLASKQRRPLAGRADVDLDTVLIHPTRHHLQAAAWARNRLEWQVLDPEIAADFAALAPVEPGQFAVVSRDRADRAWLVGYDADTAPARYYAYDRASRRVAFLFTARPELERYRLAPMQPVTIPSRDGLDLVSYLTTPAGRPPQNLPLVLNVHGGPWVRDEWGYDAEAQWFASRGYACLQVNYRGSTGFGKRFMNAGNREWGAKMHDDLIDAVHWAIGQGVADPKRVAIYGGSYGGYAALVGAAFTPDVFCAAVDIVGPSNIATLIESIPPYWAPLKDQFRIRVGDIEKEPEFVRSRSPLFRADQIRIPMLIAQGANDPRVKQAESEQIVAALRGKGKDVMYLLFPDEGHGFAVPENRMAFYAAAEQFLAKHLGGACEPPSAAEAEILARVQRDN
jgi:dipeptidyl aminopeptidase/acylaminoacyl peptidase